MKEKVKKFLSNNFISISMYISLACIAIWNSTLALVIYATIIHVSLLLLTLGLYYPDIIKPITKPRAKKILFRAIYTFIAVTILVITKHWYILCVYLCCVFLAFVYMYDWAENTSIKQTKTKDY